MQVLFLAGSISDVPVCEKGIEVLKKYEISYEFKIMSAHRDPELVRETSKNAINLGVKVIIAAAGKSAHLPGVVASYTSLPVIGLPIKSTFMDGLDSLLSIAQMPSGVPVATVGIDSAKNAALLAVRILATFDEKVFKKISDDL